MNEPHRSHADPPQVSVLLDQTPDELAAPAPLPPTSNRLRLVGLFGVLTVAAALLWSAAQGTDERIEEAQRAAEPPADDQLDSTVAPSPIPEVADDQLERSPMGDFISSPVRDENRWIALRRAVTGSRLVESTDGLVWKPIDGEITRSNLYGLDRFEGTWRTMVNSASLGEQRFTLRTQESVDGLEWNQLAGSVQKSASGNQPTNADLRFGTSVAVGDQPLRPLGPPVPLVELLTAYGSGNIAFRTCSIASVPGETASFDLRLCDGTSIGRIIPANQQQLSTLSTVAFLLQFESVVLVQVDGQALHTVTLPPGDQVASIQATPTGFIAVIIETLAGINADGTGLDDPTGKLVTWSVDTGLVDVTAGLDSKVDLADWFANQLEIGANGNAIYSTPTAVLRSAAPYISWDVSLEIPDESIAPGVMFIGPDGSGALHQDQLGRTWIGRVGGSWVRVPQLDGANPLGVLLSTPTHVTVIVEFDAFVTQLVRVPVPASDSDPS